MNIILIISAVAVLGLLGLLFGILLSIASSVFAVHVDERIEKIANVLPGANCGGCGFAGCNAYADAIVTKGVSCALCSPGGKEAFDSISEIMGTSSEFVKKVATIKCAGGCSEAVERYNYAGLSDCRAAMRIGGGQKACDFACIGLGTCVHLCLANAITIQNGIAHFDPDKCGGCGRCVQSCPKKIIEILPIEKKYYVLCSSQHKGAEMKGICSVGCIGCGICVKNCEAGAITLENNLAHIDPDKCIGCGICAEKCPKKIIKSLYKQPSEA